MTAPNSRMISPVESELRQPIVDATVPVDSCVLSAGEAAPDAVRIDRSAEIGQNGVRVVQLVRRTDPSRRVVRHAQVARDNRRADRRVDSSMPSSSTRRCVTASAMSRTSRPNLSPMRCSSIECGYASRTQSSMTSCKNPRDDGVVVAAISRQDDRDVRRPREVRQHAFPYAPVDRGASPQRPARG